MNKRLIRESIATAFIFFLTAGFSLYTAVTSAQDYTINFNAQNSSPEFHIDKDGNAVIYQARVVLTAGTSFYSRFYVGDSFIRFLVKSAPDAKAYRRFGDVINIQDIAVGDVLNIRGTVEGNSDSLSIVASEIVDFTDQKQISSGLRGTVSGLASSTAFTMLTNSGDTVTVNISTTTQIKKGNRILDIGHITVGDKITDTAGTFDHATGNLNAQIVVVYSDMSIYKPRNFQGTLKSVAAGTPTTLVATIEGKDYTVVLSSATLIMNNKRKKIALERYLGGDTVRLYGQIRETDEPTIDAEVLRNLDL